MMFLFSFSYSLVFREHIQQEVYRPLVSPWFTFQGEHVHQRACETENHWPKVRNWVVPVIFFQHIDLCKIDRVTLHNHRREYFLYFTPCTFFRNSKSSSIYSPRYFNEHDRTDVAIVNTFDLEDFKTIAGGESPSRFNASQSGSSSSSIPRAVRLLIREIIIMTPTI